MFLIKNNPIKILPFKSWSIKTVLFIWLVPIVSIFMILAWITHGVLLDKETERLIEYQLDSESTEIENQLRLILSQDDYGPLLENYLEAHVHHGIALKIDDRIEVSTLWRPILEPVLKESSVNPNGVFFSTILTSKFEYLIIRLNKFSSEKLTLLIAEDISQLRYSNGSLHNSTALVFLMLSLAMLMLIVLAVNLALKPIDDLIFSLKQLQTGIRDRLPNDTPPEFQGLVQQTNQLLDSLGQRLKLSRQAISDLSHSIKTPVAAIRNILMDFNLNLDEVLRTRLADKLTTIDKQLEIEMHRVRFGGPQSGNRAKPLPQARELVWMLGRLHVTKEFELNTIIDEDHHWIIEEQDFNEVVGNITDNAGRWAKHLVTIDISENNLNYCIKANDDGPGVNQEIINKILSRSAWPNSEVSGHGLGLPIVIDIVNRYQGAITLSNNKQGGFSVLIEIPKSNISNGKGLYG